MKFEQYKAKRDGLMLQAKAAMEAGNMEKFAELKNQVEQLDNEYEAAQTAQANFRALENSAHTMPAMQNLGGAMAGGEPQDLSRVDPFDSAEYSQAFMNFVCRGTALPAKFVNVAATTTSTDAGAVIPKTILKEIVKKLRAHGAIFQSLRHLNVQGGVEIPVLDLKPKANWVTETKASDDQKVTANTSVSFSYFGLECKIAQSILVSVVTLEEFQDLFVDLATDAIIEAVEIGVFKGTGHGQMTGICVDERVTNKVTMADADFPKWEKWKKQVFAKIPKAYQKGTFYMAQSTFDGYIDGMTDTQGQPIGRVNYGIGDAPAYRFGGKPVETVEDDVIVPYDTAEPNDVVAVYADLKDYVFNSNMQMTVVHWIDNDNNKKKSKVMLICDGKIVDPNGVVLVLKKGS